MASFNSVVFLSLLVAVSAFMAAPSTVEAGVREVENVINVTGKVPCAYNTTILRNGSLASPPFPNATVQLQCGKNNTIEGTNTTNSNGMFSIIVEPGEGLLGTLIQSVKFVKNCSVAVITPLSTCNVNLTSNGTLRSPLEKGGIDREGDTRMFVLTADKFKFANQTQPIPI